MEQAIEISDGSHPEAGTLADAEKQRLSELDLCKNIASVFDVDTAVVLSYFYGNGKRDIDATRREIDRRSSGKCLLLTQTAKPQQSYFRACLEGHVPVGDTDCLVSNDNISTNHILEKSMLRHGEDYDDVKIFFSPSYEVVEAHISSNPEPSASIDRFVDEHVLSMGYKECVGIVTGSDGSAPLCDVVNEAIGQGDFVSNDVGAFADCRRDKVKMHHAIREYAAASTPGTSSSSPSSQMLYIKSIAATNAEDARVLIEQENLQFPLIAKPATGAGSEFIHFCLTHEDVATAFKVTNGLKTTQHTSTETMCVQEYIEGDEFVVNVVSYHGIHVVTDCWESVKYPMAVLSDRLRSSVKSALTEARPEFDTTTIVYDRLKFIPDVMSKPSDSKIAQVVAYTLRCLDALHVRNGCSHSELRYDAKRGGPCLIEMNPRMQGDVPRATAFVGYDQVSLWCYLIRVGRERLEQAEGASNLGKYWPPPGVPLLYQGPPSRSSSSCISGAKEGGNALHNPKEDRTCLVIFLLVKEDGVVCEAGRKHMMRLPTFSRFTRCWLGEPQAGMVNTLKKTTDIFSCPGAVVLVGSDLDVERDALVIRKMENDRVNGILPFFSAARQLRQRWRYALATYQSQRDKAGRRLQGHDQAHHDDVDTDDEGEKEEDEIQEEDVKRVELRATEAVLQALQMFKSLDPPPLFIAESAWVAIRDSSCGKVCGASWCLEQ